jgi:hypothetical protein
MLQPIRQDLRLNEEGKPAGGTTSGLGLFIEWQNGPVGLNEPNGAFIETVIEAAKGRLEWYQANGFECAENAHAINYLNLALNALYTRTQRRQERGVEGTYEK